MSIRAKKRIFAIIRHLVMAFAAILVLIPTLMIVVNAFKDKRGAAAMNLELPTQWHFENFGRVIENGKLISSFLNSLEYTVVAVALSVVLSALCAFILSRNRTRLNRALYLTVVLGIAMPINYASLMKVMQVLGLVNTRLGLSLLYAAIQIPFSVFLMYGFVAGLPVELDEAAILDGCGPIGLFFRIVLPLLKPAAFTASILNFLNCWNEFVLPLYYMNSSSAWPMTLSVYNFFGRYSSDWNLVCADILLTCLPVLAVYLIGQKYIISGMTAGAVKG
jgi:raffinose/stachyose/melibiose transport system permease protein